MDAEGFRALHDLAGCAPLERVLFRVGGDKALAFLQDVSTQDLAGLAPGEGALTCFLDEKGRLQAEARALVLDDGSVLLDAEPASREHLGGWLARVAPLSGCEIVDETSAWQVAAVRGPRSAAALGRDADLPREHQHQQSGDRTMVRVLWGLVGYDVIAPAASRIGVARAVDPSTFEAARIAGGRPRFGVDIEPGTLINETPLLARATAPEKGCYPGQESVARVANRGRIRRHLIAARLAGPPPPPGSAILAGEADAGRVTSAAAVPDGSALIAQVSADVSDGATIRVEGAEGVARVLA